MAKYRVKVPSFINHSLVNEGDIIEFDGIPGDNLEPVDKAAEKAAKDAAKANEESKERQALAASGVDLPAGDQLL